MSSDVEPQQTKDPSPAPRSSAKREARYRRWLRETVEVMLDEEHRPALEVAYERVGGELVITIKVPSAAMGHMMGSRRRATPRNPQTVEALRKVAICGANGLRLPERIRLHVVALRAG